ncbi:MAG: DUF4915 domain-containing protein [bacterium]
MNNKKILLVLGAINVNAEDRYLNISELKPVQIIKDTSLEEIPYFSNKNIYGISSAVMHEKENLFFYSFGYSFGNEKGIDIVKINMNNYLINRLSISNLRDVHELKIIDNILWIANTGFDEAVGYDIYKNKVTKRIQLKEIPLIFSSEKKVANQNDRFHLNQIFKGLDNDLYALVHHIDGKQEYHNNEKLKKQGNGGVINLSKNVPIQLNLKSPHSVRLIENNYWVFDSARLKINIYNKEWNFFTSIPTLGYGRGGIYDEQNKIFYAGISKIRKRYLKVFSKQYPNMIQIINTKSRENIENIYLDNIEQVNDLILLDTKQAEVLRQL